MDESVVAVERAMVAIRRSQSRRALGRLGEGDGIDPSVFGVLDAIEGLGRPATVTEVAARLDVDQPRASRLVARAVAEGLVVRAADQEDGRRTLLTITAGARERLEAVHGLRREVFAAAMAGWSDADRAGFARLLTAFVESYGALTR